jgi:hypothetical protein
MDIQKLTGATINLDGEDIPIIDLAQAIIDYAIKAFLEANDKNAIDINIKNGKTFHKEFFEEKDKRIPKFSVDMQKWRLSNKRIKLF